MTADEMLSSLRPDLEALTAKYSKRGSALLDCLYAAQEKYGFVPPEAEEAVAGFLGMPVSRVREALSFYTLFRRKPPPRYRLQVCRTLVCAVCGEADLSRVIRDKLGLADGGATPDGLFSLEAVECLGACEMAPAIRINDEPARGPLNPESLARLLDELTAEGSRNGPA